MFHQKCTAIERCSASAVPIALTISIQTQSGILNGLAGKEKAFVLFEWKTKNGMCVLDDDYDNVEWTNNTNQMHKLEEYDMTHLHFYGNRIMATATTVCDIFPFHRFSFDSLFIRRNYEMRYFLFTFFNSNIIISSIFFVFRFSFSTSKENTPNLTCSLCSFDNILLLLWVLFCWFACGCHFAKAMR